MNYNTLEGIEAFLSDGLAGLHCLLEARRAARDESGLERFILVSRFLLTETNVLRITWDRELPWDLTRTVPLRMFEKILPHYSFALVGTQIPTEKDTCLVCGFGWHLYDCHDTVVRRFEGGELPVFYHSRCDALRRSQRDLSEFSDLFAGLVAQRVVRPIPNEYWKEGADWALVETPFGAVKVGWRKRVIHLSWDEIAEQAGKRAAQKLGPYATYFDQHRAAKQARQKLAAEVLFVGEDVTKNDYMIHAWGLEPARAYLQTLFKACKAVW